jgi:hypothetical protein
MAATPLFSSLWEENANRFPSAPPNKVDSFDAIGINNIGLYFLVDF